MQWGSASQEMNTKMDELSECKETESEQSESETEGCSGVADMPQLNGSATETEAMSPPVGEATPSSKLIVLIFGLVTRFAPNPEGPHLT